MTSVYNYLLGTSLIILVIILIRKIWGAKCNPNIRYFLWIFVAVRILIPMEISLEVPAGMLQFSKTVQSESSQADKYEDVFSANVAYQNTSTDVLIPEDEVYHSGVSEEVAFSKESADEMLLGENPEKERVLDKISLTRSQLKQAALRLWLAGSLLLTAYIATANFHVFNKLKKQKVMRLEDRIDVYLVEGCNCLAGIINPRIYVSPEVFRDTERCKYVLKHEMEHYKAGDCYWQFLRTICLILQWFNPLVWIAYFKSQEDCELACDYRVTRRLNQQEKEDYALTLLQVLRQDAGKHATFVTATAVGNNKHIMKKRLESIFKGNGWKWAEGVSALAVILVIGIATFISLQEKEKAVEAPSENEVQEVLVSDKPDVSEETKTDDSSESMPEGRIYGDLDLDAYSEEIWAEERMIDGTRYHVIKVKNRDGKEAEALFRAKNEEPAGCVQLQIAPLNKENNLIVSLTDYTSNCGSTDIHVLHLVRNEQGIELVEDLTILDGNESSPVYEEYLDTVLYVDLNWVSTSGEILIHNDGYNILKVESLTTQGDTRRYIYREENQWKYAYEYSYIGQWDVIARNKDMWLTYMDYANDVQCYTVTDLDENGRLEIIVSSMGGTGNYSYNRFYEVNETFDGLVECATDYEEGNSQPDICIINEESTRVFRDGEGKLHYVFTDWLKNGAAEYYNTYYDMWLENGQIRNRVLAAEHGMVDNTGKLQITYTNVKGTEITKEQYQNAVDDAFTGYTEVKGILDWRDLKELADADEAEIYTKLSGISSGLIRGELMIEEVPRPWIQSLGEEFYDNAHYIKAIDSLVNERLLPDGQAAYVGDGEVDRNRVAYMDIDQDGRKELLLDIGGTCMGDMGIYVYQLNESLVEDNRFGRELAAWFDTDFYTNGLAVEQASHNHGYSDLPDFWPYSVAKYDAKADAYKDVWDVDAWEKKRCEKDRSGNLFPDDIDIDGDGVVYRITNMETGELMMMDKEDYQSWSRGLFQGAEVIKIPWVQIPE